jgi:threonine/homoserine/homoserine lactone efflux protein
MPDLNQFALFLAAAFVLAITPGPGIFYVAARTLAGGRAEGVASSCGTGLGGMVHVIAGSLGVSAIVLASGGTIHHPEADRCCLFSLARPSHSAVRSSGGHEKFQ